MKKFYAISGAISSILGFILYLSARTTINANSRYTWSPPYTSYETEILTMKWIGIILLICGIIDLLLLVASQIYMNQNVQTLDNQLYQVTKCSNCGLQVRKTAVSCPRCKTNLSHEEGQTKWQEQQ